MVEMEPLTAQDVREILVDGSQSYEEEMAREIDQMTLIIDP